jgi:hypothetical protein
MKNRKRETCTSGSVRDEGGNILIYSAAWRGGGLIRLASNSAGATGWAREAHRAFGLT